MWVTLFTVSRVIRTRSDILMVPSSKQSSYLKPILFRRWLTISRRLCVPRGYLVLQKPWVCVNRLVSQVFRMAVAAKMTSTLFRTPLIMNILNMCVHDFNYSGIKVDPGDLGYTPNAPGAIVMWNTSYTTWSGAPWAEAYTAFYKYRTVHDKPNLTLLVLVMCPMKWPILLMQKCKPKRKNGLAVILTTSVRVRRMAESRRERTSGDARLRARRVGTPLSCRE